LYNLETYINSLVDGRSAKIISAIDSVLISLVLAIIAGTQPASGYEISIYNVYPWYFWLFISILLASPLISIILENIGQTQFSYLNIPIFYALLSIIVLLSLPAFRGYPFYGAGDIYSHLGMINDISFTGHFGINNPYPGIHIWIHILASILSCSFETISLYLTQILFTLYIASIFLLSRALKYSHMECLSITSFAILPAFGSWLAAGGILPSTDAFLLIPLVLFCVIKARLADHEFHYSVLSVVLLILFPFLHVEPTAFLFVTLILFSFIFKLNGIKSDAYTAAIILLVGCLAWFSSTLAFSGSIRNVYEAFILGLVPATPPLQEIINKGFRIEIVDAINGIIRIYGPAIVYLGIGGSVSVFNLIKFIYKKNVSLRDIFLSALLLVYAFLNFAFLFKGTALGFSIFRQIKFSLMISTFIIGQFFAGQLISKNRRIACHSFLILFIIAISILMVYSIYPSSSTYSINYQPTESDIAGMNFFFSHRNDTFLIIEPISRNYQGRWGDKLNIKDKSALRTTGSEGEDIRPPSHFGYDHHDHAHLGDFYNYSRYLLIYPPCEIYYPTLYPKYPEFWEYSPENFESLDQDPTVNMIYSNYALKTILVHPN